MIVFKLDGFPEKDSETAARIIGRAAVLSGLNVQMYLAGGSPYIKADKKPITSRQAEEPDYLVLMNTKFDVKAVAAGMKQGSVVIFNSPEKIRHAALQKRKIKAYSIDAAGIAMTRSDKKSTNIIMLGALIKMVPAISAKSAKAAMESELADAGKGMAAAFEEGYKCLR